MKKTFLLFIMAAIIVAHPSASYSAFIAPSKNVANNSAPVSSVPSDVLKQAMADLKNLSRSERRFRIKEAKKVMHDYKAAKRANAEPSTNTLLLVILAILLPPLAVYLHQGEINNKFWLALLLTLLFFVPGIIYALIVVLGKD